jgi:glycosyltransferase involved in cell wall biosynthesis
MNSHKTSKTAKPRQKRRAGRATRPPLVSCLLPVESTILPAAIRCFQRQVYPRRELLVICESGGRVARLLPPDPTIRAVELPAGVDLATRLDYACHLSEGEYLCHWDGTAWCGPKRLGEQLEPLLSGRADVTGFDPKVFFDPSSGQWWSCTDEVRRRIFAGGADERSLMFPRGLWERHAKLARRPGFLREELSGSARLGVLPAEGRYVALPHASISCGVSGGAEGWQRAAPALKPAEKAWYGGEGLVSATAVGPLVTCMMPTADRPGLLSHAIAQFLEQDYPHRELLVVDGGAMPVEAAVPADPRIRYLRAGRHLTLGALRNLACREARGALIAHWDDDDWMAPWRLRYQIDELLASGGEMCGLDRLYFADWAGRRAWEYVYPADDTPWVAGGTLCYWKETWRRQPFPDVNVGEDNAFVWAAKGQGLLRLRNQKFYVASVHARNTSPKLILPDRWHARPFDEIASLAGDRAIRLARALAGPKPMRVTKGPMVTCIMATGDRPRFVRQAIRCFLRQSFQPAELVVVDDGQEPVEELCRGLLNVRYLRCPGPMSLGAKLNHGMEHARGEIVQKWDDDDYYGPEFLAQAAGALQNVEPGRGIVAWCCFTVLLPGEESPRFSGHGWAAGATLCFHRELGLRTRFRDVPREVDRGFLEDAGVEIRRVCAPESLMVVRHGSHTWRYAEGLTTVEEYFRDLPSWHMNVAEVVEPLDRPFYSSLVRGREI